MTDRNGGDGKVVEVEDLSARYGEDVVLQDVSLDVFRGEILVVAGASGCGKSTLLRHMIGLSVPSEGRVKIDGIDITIASEKTLRAVRREIGVLFQSSALLGSMTLGGKRCPAPVGVYRSSGTRDRYDGKD